MKAWVTSGCKRMRQNIKTRNKSYQPTTLKGTVTTRKIPARGLSVWVHVFSNSSISFGKITFCSREITCTCLWPSMAITKCWEMQNQEQYWVISCYSGKSQRGCCTEIPLKKSVIFLTPELDKILLCYLKVVKCLKKGVQRSSPFRDWNKTQATKSLRDQ